MNDIDAIKAKIKKLLALSKSPNENEAVAALEKANVLMSKYKLLETDCMNFIDASVKATKKRCEWRSTLASSVGWLY